PLFRRSTRKIELTDFGRRMIKEMQSAVHIADRMQALLTTRENVLSGHVRIGTPAGFAHAFLGREIAQFSRTHPAMSFEITYVERAAYPVEMGLDVIFGGFQRTFDGVTDIPLCPMRRVTVASPVYLERAG